MHIEAAWATDHGTIGIFIVLCLRTPRALCSSPIKLKTDESMTNIACDGLIDRGTVVNKLRADGVVRALVDGVDVPGGNRALQEQDAVRGNQQRKILVFCSQTAMSYSQFASPRPVTTLRRSSSTDGPQCKRLRPGGSPAALAPPTRHPGGNPRLQMGRMLWNLETRAIVLKVHSRFLAMRKQNLWSSGKGNLACPDFAPTAKGRYGKPELSMSILTSVCPWSCCFRLQSSTGGRGSHPSLLQTCSPRRIPSGGPRCSQRGKNCRCRRVRPRNFQHDRV